MLPEHPALVFMLMDGMILARLRNVLLEKG